MMRESTRLFILAQMAAGLPALALAISVSIQPVSRSRKEMGLMTRSSSPLGGT